MGRGSGSGAWKWSVEVGRGSGAWKWSVEVERGSGIWKRNVEVVAEVVAEAAEGAEWKKESRWKQVEMTGLANERETAHP